MPTNNARKVSACTSLGQISRAISFPRPSVSRLGETDRVPLRSSTRRRGRRLIARRRWRRLTRWRWWRCCTTGILLNQCAQVARQPRRCTHTVGPRKTRGSTHTGSCTITGGGGVITTSTVTWVARICWGLPCSGLLPRSSTRN